MRLCGDKDNMNAGTKIMRKTKMRKLYGTILAVAITAFVAVCAVPKTTFEHVEGFTYNNTRFDAP